MTRFYELDTPSYEDDFEGERINPVWITTRCHIPALVCPACGIISNFFDKIRIPLPSQDVQNELKSATTIPLADWPNEVRKWAKRLGVDPELITPGAEVGPPAGLLNGMPSKDIIYPSSMTWVRARVKEKLESIGCTGIEFAKAELIYRGAEAEPVEFCGGCYADYDPIDPNHLPDYWELRVVGTAWRVGQDNTTIKVCRLCGNVKYRKFDELKIDESRWDGSDFFRIKEWLSIFVTDRVCKALEELGATNYVCKPLP